MGEVVRLDPVAMRRPVQATSSYLNQEVRSFADAQRAYQQKKEIEALLRAFKNGQPA
jgi:hypothetical protein